MSKKFLVSFLLVNSIICCYYLDTWENGNTTSRMLAVMNVVNSGTFQFDNQQARTFDKACIRGHYYSEKAPLPMLMVIPFYKLITCLGYQENGEGKIIYILGSVLCGVIPFLIISLLFLKAAAKEPHSFSPVLLSMLPLYASFIFIYSSTFYNHLLAALFLLLSYIYLKKGSLFLAGLFIGLSFLSEYSVAVIIAVWGLQLCLKKKTVRALLEFAAGASPAILFILVYNYIFTGSPFLMLYKFHTSFVTEAETLYGFSYPKLKALWGLTFSLYRGLFFYAPFLLFYFFYLINKWIKYSPKMIAKKILQSYSGLATLSLLIVLSSETGWWGGWAYGPRYLLLIAVLLTYKGVIYLSSIQFSKIAFLGVTIFGLICALSAKITVLYSIPTDRMNPFTEIIWPAIIHSDFNPNNLLTMLLGIAPVIGAALFVLLFILGVIFLQRTDVKQKQPEH